MTSPRSSKYKVAFTGTNSSGKTTMALEVTARLKRQYHVLAEVVSSQDRKITWKDEHFPVDPRAHYGMISNLVKAEVEAELKGDAEIVITDRSVLDLYAIALTDHPDHPMVKQMEGCIRSWMTSYTHVFYLPPLDYQEDGKRPPNEFRMQTHATLRRLIEQWQLPNVVDHLDRPAAFKQILKTVGKDEVKPIFAQGEKWQAVANSIGLTLVVKQDGWPSTSDIDLFVVLNTFADFRDGEIVNEVQARITAFFGTQVKVDVLTIPREAMSVDLPFLAMIYEPAK